uniref:Uncharacterized protein n=1 Tax=Salvator merianae TaxID=96440 RepID=A0A8D0E1Q7_SALMN
MERSGGHQTSSPPSFCCLLPAKGRISKAEEIRQMDLKEWGLTAIHFCTYVGPPCLRNRRGNEGDHVGS